MKTKINWLQIVYGIIDIIIGALFIFEAIMDFNKLTNPDNAAAALALVFLFILVFAFLALIFLIGVLFIIYGLLFIFSAIKIKNKVIIKRWMIISILVLQIIILIFATPYTIRSNGISKIIAIVAVALLVITCIIKIVDLILEKKNKNHAELVINNSDKNNVLQDDITSNLEDSNKKWES